MSDKIEVSLAVIEEKLDKIESKLDTIDRLIFRGNGQESLVAKVIRNEEQLEELKWLRRTAIAGASTGVLGLLMALFERLS